MNKRKQKRPDNDIEQRNSIEIVSEDKGPLLRQIMDLYVARFEKP